MVNSSVGVNSSTSRSAIVRSPATPVMKIRTIIVTFVPCLRALSPPFLDRPSFGKWGRLLRCCQAGCLHCTAAATTSNPCSPPLSGRIHIPACTADHRPKILEGVDARHVGNLVEYYPLSAPSRLLKSAPLPSVPLSSNQQGRVT